MVQLLDSSGQPMKSGLRFKASDTAHRAASLRARELASWMPLLGSADSDLLSELPTLVSRSRDLTRNHGVAAGAIQTLVDNVIGTGLRLASIPDYRALVNPKNGRMTGRVVLKVNGVPGRKARRVMRPMR
jgi:capsid protein